MQLVRQNKLPTHERSADELFAEVSMRSTAPAQPINTPSTLRAVIGYLRNKAAAIMVKTGVRVTTIEASTGEVEESPTTKLI